MIYCSYCRTDFWYPGVTISPKKLVFTKAEGIQSTNPSEEVDTPTSGQDSPHPRRYTAQRKELIKGFKLTTPVCYCPKAQLPNIANKLSVVKKKENLSPISLFCKHENSGAANTNPRPDLTSIKDSVRCCIGHIDRYTTEQKTG